MNCRPTSCPAYSAYLRFFHQLIWQRQSGDNTPTCREYSIKSNGKQTAGNPAKCVFKVYNWRAYDGDWAGWNGTWEDWEVQERPAPEGPERAETTAVSWFLWSAVFLHDCHTFQCACISLPAPCLNVVESKFTGSLAENYAKYWNNTDKYDPLTRYAWLTVL